MARAFDSDVLVDSAGNAIANAVGLLFTDAAATVAVSDAYTAASGGSPVTQVTTGSDGKYSVFFGTPKTYYVQWTDNDNTAYPVGAPTLLKSWTPFVARHVALQDPADDITDEATLAASLAAHLADTVDAHDASAISVTPATGATPTDLQTFVTRVGQTQIDVRNHGLLGDNSTDNATAIAAMITAQGAAHYHFPPGSYRTSDPLTLTRLRGTRLSGQSRYASKLIGVSLGSDALIAVQSCRDTRIEHLYLDGGGTTGAIIDSTRLDGSSLSGRNLRVYDCKVGGDSTGSAAYGIRIGTGTDINQDIMVLDDIEFAHLTTAIYATYDSGTLGKNSYLHMFSNLAFSNCDVGIDAIGYSLDGAEFEGTDLLFRCRSNVEKTLISNVSHGDNGFTTKLLDVPADAGDGGSVFFNNVQAGGSPSTVVNAVNIDAAVDNWLVEFTNFFYLNGGAGANTVFKAPSSGNRLVFNSGRVLNITIDTAGTIVWTNINSTLLPYAGVVITGGARVERFSNDNKYGPALSMNFGKENTVASAAGTITLPPGALITVTGTSAITSITATDADIGRVVKLRFTSTASLTNGSNLKLQSSFTGVANAVINLYCDGTNWYETGRAGSQAFGSTAINGTLSVNAGSTEKVDTFVSAHAGFVSLNGASATDLTVRSQTGKLNLGNSSGTLTWDNVGPKLTFPAADIKFDTTTGTKLGTAASEKLAHYGATPIVQPTTAGSAATLVGGGGTALTDSDTFDGYTLKQVVKALRNLGLLA